MEEILIQLQSGWLQVNYVNPLLYPVIVSDYPRSERGILCILIGDLTLKIASLLLTTLSARKQYMEND